MEEWLTLFVERLAQSYDVSVATHGPCHPVVRDRFDSSGARWYDFFTLVQGIASARAWMRASADIAHFSLLAPRSVSMLAAATLPKVSVVYQDCYSIASVPITQSGLDPISWTPDSP